MSGRMPIVRAGRNNIAVTGSRAILNAISLRVMSQGRVRQMMLMSARMMSVCSGSGGGGKGSTISTKRVMQISTMGIQMLIM